MQAAVMCSTDSNGFAAVRNPARSFVEMASRDSQRDLSQRCAKLFSAGIARAPLYDRNWMLSGLFLEGPDVASGEIAEAVVNWLSTGRVERYPVNGLGRYQLGEQRSAHWLYETYTQATLRRDAWRRYPELRPILVEGSPDKPHTKTSRKLGAVRRTHHFVMLRVAGRMYVIDGARGMVFDSLGAYLDSGMLAGLWGEENVRMKWFRIIDSGRETQGDWTMAANSDSPMR